MKLAEAIGTLIETKTMADDYGTFQERQPISKLLKVSPGAIKPKSRMKESKFNPQPLGNIARGDRSQTLWAKRSKIKDSLATVETSSIYPADELTFDDMNENYIDSSVI